MRALRRFMTGPKVNRTLHEAIDDAATKKGLKSGKWYKVEEIYVRKDNPITDYSVVLDPTPLDHPPPP